MRSISGHLLLARTLSLAGAMAFLASADGAYAASLAYDGFAAGGLSPGVGQYVSEPASTNGSNNDSLLNQGPVRTGFTGNWTGTAGNFASTVYYRINDVSLTYGTLETEAGQVELFRSTGSNSSDKPITRALNFTGGDSFYVSMLLRTTYLHSIELKLFPSVSSISIGTNSLGQAVIRYAGGAMGNSVNALSLNTTHMLVARVNADDTFALWVDPTDLSSEGANTPVATGGGVVYTGGSSFTSLQMSSTATSAGASTILDEIRVGSTWSGAVVPEPTGMLLAIAGLAGLAARRR